MIRISKISLWKFGYLMFFFVGVYCLILLLKNGLNLMNFIIMAVAFSLMSICSYEGEKRNG